MRFTTRSICFIPMLLMAAFAAANPTVQNTNTALAIGSVVEILQQETDEYGDCMIKLQRNGAIINPNDAFNECGNTWISLSCNGTHHAKSVAAGMLGSAQLSLVTGNRLGVYFDKTKKHGAYCSAFRIDTVNSQ